MSMSGEIEIIGFEQASAVALALVLNGYEVVVSSFSELYSKEERAYTIKFCHPAYEGRQFVIYDNSTNEIVFDIDGAKQKLCECEEKKDEQNTDGSNS